MSQTEIGTKHDGGKLRWDLVPWAAFKEIVRVITFGANKYNPNNWQKLADPKGRYFAALLRHLVARQSGEMCDPETGILHMAHAGCNVVFLIWFDLKVEPKVKEENHE